MGEETPTPSVFLNVPISNIEWDKLSYTELCAPLWVCAPTEKSHTKGTKETATAATTVVLAGCITPRALKWYIEFTMGGGEGPLHHLKGALSQGNPLGKHTQL